nr:P0 protein [Carrot enamovirus 1]
MCARFAGNDNRVLRQFHGKRFDVLRLCDYYLCLSSGLEISTEERNAVNQSMHLLLGNLPISMAPHNVPVDETDIVSFDDFLSALHMGNVHIDGPVAPPNSEEDEGDLSDENYNSDEEWM